MDGESCGEGLIAIAIAYANYIIYQVVVLAVVLLSRMCNGSSLFVIVGFDEKGELRSVKTEIENVVDIRLLYEGN
jgi:hypothetical protein